ncbi:MAG TPA: T9SS type A sorting domain-containing protein [Saprospiraceae bacterium]|nr:T9SS type A sorting domain-containing protein [Saprospiraceae bacterium]
MNDLKLIKEKYYIKHAHIKEDFRNPFSVSPTPPNELINIDNLDNIFNIRTTIKLSICNLLGQTIMLYSYEKLPNVINLDISALKDGMYIIKIESGSLSCQQKIIKAKSKL